MDWVDAQTCLTVLHRCTDISWNVRLCIELMHKRVLLSYTDVLMSAEMWDYGLSWCTNMSYCLTQTYWYQLKCETMDWVDAQTCITALHRRTDISWNVRLCIELMHKHVLLPYTDVLISAEMWDYALSWCTNMSYCLTKIYWCQLKCETMHWVDAQTCLTALHRCTDISWNVRLCIELMHKHVLLPYTDVLMSAEMWDYGLSWCTYMYYCLTQTYWCQLKCETMHWVDAHTCLTALHRCTDISWNVRLTAILI